MSHDALHSIKKLQGRSNYDTWQFAVQSYLQHEDLWGVVTGEDNDEKKCLKARSKIILLIDELNFTHVKKTKTAKEAWESLQKAFQDSGLCRRVELLKQLVNTKLTDCSSVEQYVSKITDVASKLTGIGLDVNDEWVGTLLLFGLPDEYSTMIMGIDSSGVKITSDTIKNKLLQDVRWPISSSSSSALVAKNQHQKNDNNCYICNKPGHFAKNCRRKQRNKAGGDKEKKKTCFHVAYLSVSGNQDDWYLDSGASAHMTSRKELFLESSNSTNNEVLTANGARMEVEAVGNVEINLTNGDNIEVKNVLLVPGLCTNLLSVSQMTDKGFKLVFQDDFCKVYDPDGDIVAKAFKSNGMYKINKTSEIAMVSSSKLNATMNLWHRRMGHINFNSLAKLKNDNAIGVDFDACEDDDTNCAVCMQGKQSRLPFKGIATRAKDVLELVHSDVGGPIECPSIGGSRYYVIFVDDYSRRVFVYFMRSKSEVTQRFIEFKAHVENQTEKKIKVLRTDNGTEYVNANLTSILIKAGIEHQLTAPYTPQQNGLAERMNRTLIERARCMLFDAKLDKQFWAEALNTSAYLVNRSPCRMIRGKTPMEMWTKKEPSYQMIKVFGCVCWVHVPKEKRKKLDAKSRQGIFVGYCSSSKAYRVYIPEVNDVVTSRDVEFFENQAFEKVSMNSKNNPFDFVPDHLETVRVTLTDSDQSMVNDMDGGETQQSDVTEIETTTNNESTSEEESSTVLSGSPGQTVDEDYESDESTYMSPESSVHDHNFDDDEYIPPEPTTSMDNQPIRRSAREPKPVQMNDYVTFNVSAANRDDPLSVKEAISRADSKFWLKAMDEEFAALQENKTWELVELPPNSKPIQSKWVFKTKKDSSGEIVRYKARLVIKGCSQRYGIDYGETYSPVVRYNSIRLLLGIAAKHNLTIDHMDAVTAFLQGDLEEVIYMVQPEGFAKGSKVCRLKKSLYGLKQASRIWNIKLHSVLISQSLIQSKVDPCIYYRLDNGKMLYVAVYVDDLIILSNDIQMKSKLKTNLQSIFRMKDLGEANNFLGINITRDHRNGTICIDQEKYVRDLLIKFGMEDCNPVSTPVDVNQKLSSELSPKNEKEKKEVEKIPYQAAIGSILFLSQVSRPDVCYAVNLLSRFNNNFGKAHWAAVKRVLRYLKGTITTKLVFGSKGDDDLVGYCDSDYASDLDERRSTTGYLFMYQGAPISWNSRKQPTVALSTTEAEYMAASAATQEAIWLQMLMDELTNSQSQGVPLYCDNKGALDLVQTTSYHSRTKHIDVRHHFIRNMIANNKIKMMYIPTDDMKADILTKGLCGEKHRKLCHLLGLQ